VSLGVVIAGVLVLAFGWQWLDPLLSLAIAVVIVAGTWGLFRQSLHLLFDGVPEQIDLAEVRSALEALPGVECVHDLHIWGMSSTEIALTAHLIRPDGHPDDDFYQQASQLLHARFHIDHVTLQINRQPFEPSCGR